MKRRQFIQAATSTLLVANVIGISPARSLAREDIAPNFVFFDERFERARRLAGDLAGSTALTPVWGDITEVWKSGLDRACRVSPLLMRGVTTESFYFCLKIMVGEQASLDTQVERVDRDLHLWTLHSRNDLRTAIRHG